MTWTDGHGREAVREINLTLDIRNFQNTLGFALLFVAANTHLSLTELWLWLMQNGVQRGRNWLHRRRRLFQPFGTVNSIGRPNRDGRDEEALAVMREYPTASLRYIVRVLKARGIRRGKDWVRNRRGP